MVPLLLALMYFLNVSVNRETAQLQANEFTIASMVDRSVSNFFARNVAAVEALAANPDITAMDPAKADPILGQAPALRTEFNSLFLVDGGGIIVSPGMNPPVDLVAQVANQIDQTITNRQVQLSDRITIGNDITVVVLTMPVITTSETDNPVTGTTQPPPDTALEVTPTPGAETTPAGQVVGAIGAVIRIDPLEQLVIPLARDQTEIAVVRSNEILFATAGIRRDEAAFLRDNAETIELASSGKSSTFSSVSTDGDELAGVFQPTVLEGYTWATIVTNPAPESYIQDLWVQGLLVILLTAMAILAVAIVIGELTARPLRTLATQATAMQEGDYSTKVEPVGSGEILTLSTALADLTLNIEDQVHDLEEVKQIRESQTRQMRDLLRRTLRLQEDEQRRIAGEIHDAVSPLITGALYQARALQMSNGTTPHDEREAALSSVNHLLERATEELHGVIFDLRPPDLDDLGIVAAIEAYVSSIQRTSIDVGLDLVEEPSGLASDVRLGIYRIVQEALHNVMRHSGADEALVRLESTEDLLRLTIRDNGSGFDPETSIRPTSLGLLSMRERAAAIGATLTIVSRPGGGTAIILERAHTGSVMSDEVLADLISVENTRWSQSGNGMDDGEIPAGNGDPVHNGTSTSVAAEEEP
jgi:signal transduction histidine kinase